MAWLRRTRNRSTAQYSEFADPVRQLLAEVFASRAAFPIMPEELPAVVAVRTLIADTVALCPLVELDADGRPVANPSPIIARPDPFEFSWLTHHRSAMELTGDGNVWLMVTARNTITGRPVAVTLLDHRDVQPHEDSQTRRILGCHWQGRYLLAERDVIHVPMNVVSPSRLGKSALRLSRPAMDAAAEIYKFARSTWAEFGAPSVKLTVPHRIDDTPDENGTTESDRLRAAWMDTHGGKRVPAVLWGGADVQAFGQLDDVSKLAEAMQLIAAEAPQAYRVPPSLVNARVAGASMTYTNVGAEMTRWIRTGLSGYFMRLEAAYTSMLEPGHRAKFDTSELEQGDSLSLQALYLALQQACGQPFLTVDEARAVDRRGPMPTRPQLPAAAEVLP